MSFESREIYNAYSAHGGPVPTNWGFTKWQGETALGEERFRNCNDTMTGICMVEGLTCHEKVDRLEVFGPGYKATYRRADTGRMYLVSK